MNRSVQWPVLLTAGLLLFMATSAWGHAFPDHSEPRAGWTVQVSPPRARIWFDGVLEPVFSTIEVVNADHQQVDNGDGVVNPADHTVLEASLPPLPLGQYQILWSVVAHDGHRTEGDISFTIGPGLSDRPRVTSTPATLPHLFVRWLNFIGLSILIGTLAFRLLLVRSIMLPRQEFETVERPLRRIELSSIVLVALATVGELILRTQMMSGGRLVEIHVTLPVVLLQTHFGAVWLVRLGFVGLLCLAWGLWRATAPQSQRAIILSLSAAMVIALTTSLSGHAGDWGDLTMPVLIDWIHLVAVSIWIGGLFTFGFLFQRLAAPPGTEEVTRGLAAIGRPFSRMAAYCVFTLLVAGFFNAWLQVRSLQPLVTTSYGLTILAKLFLVGLVLALAAVNRYYFLPLLRDPTGARNRPLVKTIDRFGGAWLVGAGRDQVARIRHRLRQFMRLEWILVIAALALAALLTHLPPARHILARIWSSTPFASPIVGQRMRSTLRRNQPISIWPFSRKGAKRAIERAEILAEILALTGKTDCDKLCILDPLVGRSVAFNALSSGSAPTEAGIRFRPPLGAKRRRDAMRSGGWAVRRSFALTVISVGALLWGCSGVHLRPESYDWVTGERTAPAAVSAAKAALAEAQAAGAANFSAARYPMAKAREYIILAEDELSDRDLAAAEMTAGIARKAAEEAKAIAQRGK